MRKDYKYYVSLVLLLILPLSAVGLDVSVHKCKHKGTVHFSFFEKMNSHNHYDCCFDEHEQSRCNEDKKSMNHSRATKRLEKSGCTDMQKNEGNNETSSCGKENNTDFSSKSEFPFVSSFQSTCCSNSEIIYSVNVVCLSFDKFSFLKLQPLFSKLYLNIIQFESNQKTSSTTIVFDYPLKKPICSIISFIHSAAKTLVDDSDDVSPISFC